MARRPGLWVEIGVNLALLTLLVSILDAGVFYLVSRSVIVDTTAGLAESAASLIASELAVRPEDEWRRTANQHLRGGIEGVVVYGPGGVPRFGGGERGGTRVQSVFVTREVSSDVEGGAVRAWAPVGSAGRAAAVVEVRMAAGTTDAPLWWVLSAHAGFAALSIAGFGYVLFQRSVVRPIDALRSATQRIAGGEFGFAVPESGPRELAELGEALSQMSRALAGYRERTADQLARLEAANNELTRTQEALVRSEKLAGVGRLAAGLAHELGNPLTAVRGYVALLNRRGVDPGTAAEVLGQCQSEVERMHALLRSLLDYARDERAHVGPVAARELLEGAVATVRHQPAFREVALLVEADPDLFVEVDARKLHQALVNLLLNAASARASTIRLGASRAGRRVAITVVDDGEGMPAEVCARAWEPFFTTREPGAGTGLGLAIVHRIVEQHGGEVGVDSEPGRGATFRLSLPAHVEGSA